MARKSALQEQVAAQALARRVGLGAIETQIIKLAKHSMLRLVPLPIVARIQSRESIDQAYANASRELMIAVHLAERAAPAVRPTPLVDPGPHVEDDCVVTLWEYVDGREMAETHADALIAVRALKEVHDALGELDADLPSFTQAIDSCKTILSKPCNLESLRSDDRLFLERLHATLSEELSRRELVCRALHGDAHPANVLITDAGATWADLEAVCKGPVEWDLVSLPSSTWPEFEDVDPDLMRILKDLRRLCVAIWCWADFDRSAEIAEAAAYHFEALKARFD